MIGSECSAWFGGWDFKLTTKKLSRPRAIVKCETELNACDSWLFSQIPEPLLLPSDLLAALRGSQIN